MPQWLIILLAAVGVFLLVVIGLFLAGKKELAKKILLFPFVQLGKALTAVIKFLRSWATSAENERIKREKEKIKQAQADLQAQIAAHTKEHEQKMAELQQKIDDNDAQAQTLKASIAEMEKKGAKEWFDALSAEKKKGIIEKADLPDLPSQFLNP